MVETIDKWWWYEKNGRVRMRVEAGRVRMRVEEDVDILFVDFDPKANPTW